MPLTAWTDVKIDEAQERLRRVGRQVLTAIGLVGMAEAQRNMLVDTGFARGHISFRLQGDEEVQFGIVSSATREGQIARYPAMMEVGIPRQFIRVRDRSGNIRMSFVKWLERHGFKVWRQVGGEQKLAIRGLYVWGRRHPWLSNAYQAVQQRMPAILRQFQEAL